MPLAVIPSNVQVPLKSPAVHELVIESSAGKSCGERGGGDGDDGDGGDGGDGGCGASAAMAGVSLHNGAHKTVTPPPIPLSTANRQKV